jgi:hypothetical protein
MALLVVIIYSIDQWGRGLQAEDLYDLIPKETTIQCQMRWAKAVEDEKQKQNRKGKIHGESHFPVWRLLYRCMGNEFMLSSLCYPFWLTSMILQVSSLEFFTISQNWEKSSEFTKDSTTKHLTCPIVY